MLRFTIEHNVGKGKFMLDLAEKFFGPVMKAKVGKLAKNIAIPTLRSKQMPIL